LTLLFAFTLSACGGGGDTSNASTAGTTSTTQQSGATGGTLPTPTLLASTAQVIEYYGDSTIWGLKSGTTDVQVATPAPTAFLGSLPSSPMQRVINKGVNGTTACDLLNGNTLLGIETNWQTQMANSSATVVIINDAINDSGVNGESIDTYKSCLSNLATIASGRGKKVIFETPNPVDRNGLDTYVTAMKEVAFEMNIPVIDQFQNLKKSLDAGTITIREMCPDGTHPSDQVYIQKGQFAASVFRTLTR
jgi:lysophospholipase L1-like esterase